MEGEIKCPFCDFRFTVIWNGDGLGAPTYCPRCGEELDYGEHLCGEADSP